MYVCTRVHSDNVRREWSQEDTDRVWLHTLCHSPNSGEMGRLLDSASFSLQYICGWGERERKREDDSWHDTGSAQLQRVQVLQVQEQRREHTHEARSRTLTVKPPPLCMCPLQGGGCPLEESAMGYITIQGCTGLQGASIGSGTLLPGQPLVVSNSTLVVLYEYKIQTNTCTVQTNI